MRDENHTGASKESGMTQHSSEKDVPPQGVSTFRMLLRRHAQVLTFVGALVVFATFIVREEVRENLKDLIASIDSAQSVFSTRRDVAVIADELDVLGTITVDISGAAMAGKTQADKFVAIFLLVRFRLLVVKARFAALAASLDNTSRLLAKLSPDSTQTAKVAELRNRLLEDQKRCKEAKLYRPD
jgi:hypothetical protein